jgi:hypothetical protein
LSCGLCSWYATSSVDIIYVHVDLHEHMLMQSEFSCSGMNILHVLILMHNNLLVTWFY